jgi:hypothetical protein
MLLLTESALSRINGRGLGATAPADPTTSIIAGLCPGGVGKTSCKFQSNASDRVAALNTFLQQAIETRFIPEPQQGATAQMIFEADARTDCASYAASGAGGSSGAEVAGITSGVAKIGTSAAVAAGAAAGSVIPIIGTVIGAITGFIAGIFGASHAKAVKGEQQDICAAVPQVNAALQQIDAGLSNGSISPSQAGGLYSQLQSQFTAALHANTTFKTGDALWAFNLALTGIIQARNQDLQNGVLTGGAPGPWTAAGKAAANLLAAIGVSSDMTPWLVIGGALALAFLL